jgi:hypothetical protein
MEGRKDGHEEVTCRFSQFCQHAQDGILFNDILVTNFVTVRFFSIDVIFLDFAEM